MLSTKIRKTVNISGRDLYHLRKKRFLQTVRKKTPKIRLLSGQTGKRVLFYQSVLLIQAVLPICLCLIGFQSNLL